MVVVRTAYSRAHLDLEILVIFVIARLVRIPLGLSFRAGLTQRPTVDTHNFGVVYVLGKES